MKTICTRDFKSFIELRLWYELKCKEYKDFEIINVQFCETTLIQGYVVYYFLNK
jgi:hypothetical protein